MGGWWLTCEDRLQDINTHCLNEFRRHWLCLENGNQQLWQCRPEEWRLNKCVYENLVSQPRSSRPSAPKPVSPREDDLLSDTVRESLYLDAANPGQKLEKVVPDQPKTSTPVHLRTRQVLADFPVLSTQKPFVAPKEDSKEGQS